MSTVRIAAAQLDLAFADPETNLGRIERTLEEATAKGARLVVFPECTVSGYCFESAEEALQVAESVPGPAVRRLEDACRRLGCTTVVGLVETDGDSLFNSAVVVGPDGFTGCYRKCHLPLLGLDRFVAAGGGPLVPFETSLGKLGLGICYDAGFPELSRALKLKGAQLIALPTNWPEGAEVSAAHNAVVRAHENHVHFVAVNRVGRERGVRFIGQSSIVDCQGRVLAVAGADEPALLLADLDLAAADSNRTVNRPGEYELDRIADRRPDLYGALVEEP